MIDLFNIPNSQQDIQIFYTNGTTNAWQTWQKPRKCNYIYIICIGGGGGGAGGVNSTLTVYSTGGASGGVSRTLFNAQQLPDTLYVQVGTGGAGGVANGSGTAGTRSFVSLTPAIGVASSIAGSGTAGAAGGTPGSSATGEPAPGQANINFLCLANFINTAGVTAVGSGVTGIPPNITPLTSQITCQGAGGSGDPSALGGSILATSISPLISGGTQATVSGTTAGNGGNGFTSYKPFFSTGGAGGGNAVAGSTGGDGGNGGIGSGGGGGGTGTTGGRGGKGGDGLVIIISF